MSLGGPGHGWPESKKGVFYASGSSATLEDATDATGLSSKYTTEMWQRRRGRRAVRARCDVHLPPGKGALFSASRPLQRLEGRH